MKFKIITNCEVKTHVTLPTRPQQVLTLQRCQQS